MGTDEVRILEDEAEGRSCQNCGVRFQSGKQSKIIGKERAQAERMSTCMKCELNPNMGLVRSLAGGLGSKQVGDTPNNWRPITDDDKSCQTCKTGRTVNAMGPCPESAVIVRNKCFHCRFSKNAAIIAEAKKRKKDTAPMVDTWVNFES